MPWFTSSVRVQQSLSHYRPSRPTRPAAGKRRGANRRKETLPHGRRPRAARSGAGSLVTPSTASRDGCRPPPVRRRAVSSGTPVGRAEEGGAIQDTLLELLEVEID